MLIGMSPLQNIIQEVKAEVGHEDSQWVSCLYSPNIPRPERSGCTACTTSLPEIKSHESNVSCFLLFVERASCAGFLKLYIWSCWSCLDESSLPLTVLSFFNEFLRPMPALLRVQPRTAAARRSKSFFSIFDARLRWPLGATSWFKFLDGEVAALLQQRN